MKLVVADVVKKFRTCHGISVCVVCGHEFVCFRMTIIVMMVMVVLVVMMMMMMIIMIMLV